LSKDKNKFDNAATIIFLVLIAATFSVLVAVNYSIHQNSAQRPMIGNIQIRSTSIDITSLNRTDLNMNLKAVLYNPNGFGATLNTAEYSVYANGHYVGSGKTIQEYDLTPQSSQTLTFPISVGWNAASKTTASYILNWGHITWMVNGTSIINIGSLSISTPFEFTTG
jgi:LEA14-like dessication related protein